MPGLRGLCQQEATLAQLSKHSCPGHLSFQTKVSVPPATKQKQVHTRPRAPLAVSLLENGNLDNHRPGQ